MWANCMRKLESMIVEFLPSGEKEFKNVAGLILIQLALNIYGHIHGFSQPPAKDIWARTIMSVLNTSLFPK